MGSWSHEQTSKEREHQNVCLPIKQTKPCRISNLWILRERYSILIKNSYQLDSVTQRVILGFEIGRPILPTNEDYAHTTFHVSGFSVLVDLWLVKINKPMILCARSTLISSKQSTKRGSREIHEVRKGMWAFSWLCFHGCWLAGQTDSNHVTYDFSEEIMFSTIIFQDVAPFINLPVVQGIFLTSFLEIKIEETMPG